MNDTGWPNPCLQLQPIFAYQSPAPVEREPTLYEVEREPRLYELVIERCGPNVRMNYGSELRLLIADPIKGIALRDAIQKLKEALLK